MTDPRQACADARTLADLLVQIDASVALYFPTYSALARAGAAGAAEECQRANIVIDGAGAAITKPGVDRLQSVSRLSAIGRSAVEVCFAIYTIWEGSGLALQLAPGDFEVAHARDLFQSVIYTPPKKTTHAGALVVGVSALGVAVALPLVIGFSTRRRGV